MSAATPAIITEEHRTEDVRASLRRLYLRRLRVNAAARMLTLTSCFLLALCLIAFLDSAWPLPRAVRAVLLIINLLAPLSVLAHAAWPLLRRLGAVEAARAVESAAGSRQNTLVTLVESFEGAGPPSGGLYILSRLERRARVELALIGEEDIAPLRGLKQGMVLLASAVFLILALRLAFPAAFAREADRVLWLAGDGAPVGQGVAVGVAATNGENAAVSIQELRVRVLPPAYSGLGVEEVAGDAPVRALAGSQVEVVLTAAGPAAGATLGFNNNANTMRALGNGRFAGAFTADASGAFEARLLTDEGTAAPAPVVRAVEVYNDVAPEARITEPAGDQLLRSLPERAVPVRWTAGDDLGLAGVTLKYIKSRGEGDAAKFTNGEVALGAIERASAREWRGAASLDLGRLDVQPGDTLVFWVEARDRKPGANNTGRSASLAIAVALPELAKLNLSDLMPNEIGRFLLSQRQIIIHTEKLHAERTRLAAAELKRRSNDIAADQREFKNSFNDYIKTEGAGEEGEAGPAATQSVEEQVRAAEDERFSPHFHGIPEPPQGAPTSVRELTYAIRAMWDAEEALTNADTALALKFEREALTRLKRAQTAVRYIPPILPQSKPIDLKRRYAGELAEIKTRLEKLSRRREAKGAAPARAALADVYAALNDLQETLGGAAGARASAVGRARDRARRAADSLMASQGGDHAATVAEAAGQLRIVEMELSRTETGGGNEEYGARIAKPLALLTQSASSLFAIVESSTRAGSGDANQLLPTNESRAAEYFRRLAGGR